MTYLGLDLGTKTLGISKSKGVIATNYKTLRHDNNYDYLIQELKNIINEEKVDKIILGYPKNMNNTCGRRVEETLILKEELENKFNLPVFLMDERLSKTEAEKVLLLGDTSRKKRKKVIDSVAATIILQTYLDMKGNSKNGK